ncbi:phage tail protein [Prodigiosinella aquatilis]|nr:phage tail protein [Prodigiosinella sp. LS101]WJV52954.1 phage tail protein [Prodigiosinella sp. LS101]WJV57309.1 phage tail protein [Pectobacteriaceae bacterium C111]
MSTKYFALLTHIGAARLANATMLGGYLNITQMAVGDGGGTLPTPDPAQTELIGEKRRAPLNSLTVDDNNSNQIIAEQVIPENEGGFWIREIGLYDADDNLIAIANCPETYKPQLQEGSGRIQTVRMILIVSNTEAVTLKIDPAVVLATRQYVDNAVIEVKAYADSQLAAHVAADNPHSQYAPTNSPALTGTPTAPTPAQATNNTQIATTAFVRSVVGNFSESFKSLLADNGYQVLPSGLILQWGTLSMTSTSANTYTILPFLFPITFPAALCSISGSIRTGLAGDAYTSFSFEKATNAGATLYYTTAGTDMFPTINWMAVGY